MIAQRSVSIFACFFFSLSYVLPLDELLAASVPPHAGPRAVGASPAAELVSSLEALISLASKEPAEQDSSTLRDIRNTIALDGQAVTQRLSAIRVQLVARGMTPAVLARHDAVAFRMREALASVGVAVDAALAARGARRSAGMKALLEVLRGLHTPWVHNALKPNKLPHRRSGARDRAPRATREDFAPLFAATTAGNTAVAPVAPTLAAGDMPSAPTAADLAETSDVQFSDGIRALAASLGGDPLSIFNWVRKNVAFTPTFGSIQGSEGCRLSRECNAHDSASLLIALLRVSGLPARYVIGTVDVNPDLFRSAVGDFPDVQDAARLAASGGIPTTLVRRPDGTLSTVRIEHAWVEAYVDYVPSRGLSRRQGDTWVPLDPALKRARFEAPEEIVPAVGGDLGAFRDELLATATVGDAGQSMTGVSSALARDRIDQFRDAVPAYIRLNRPDATIGQLLGAVDVEANPLGILPASVAAKVVVVGGRTPDLPRQLQHRLAIELLDSDSLEPLISVELGTPELAAKRLTLGYPAASDTDVQTIQSFGGFLKVPPHLVNLRPTVFLDGRQLAAGEPTAMGTTQVLRVTFGDPDGTEDAVEHLVSAGSYVALGLNLQKMTDTAVQDRQARLEVTRARLGVEAVPTDEVIGEVLHMHALAYFLKVDATDRLSAHKLNVVAAKQPGELLASFEMNFATVFGTPVEVASTGLTVDVRRHVQAVASRDGNHNAERSYLLTSGVWSSLAENSIFEELTRTPAVSAVKLIAEANRQSIPISLIDQSNADTLVPLLQVSPSVLTDVINAVSSGQQVLIPRREVSVGQWRGSGYVVLDPETGAAAYLISGALSGGSTSNLSDNLNNLNYLMDAAGFLVAILGVLLASVALEVFAAILTALGLLVAGWYLYAKTGSLGVAAFDTIWMLIIASFLMAFPIALGFASVLLVVIVYDIGSIVLTNLITMSETASRPVYLRPWLYALLEGRGDPGSLPLDRAPTADVCGAIA